MKFIARVGWVLALIGLSGMVFVIVSAASDRFFGTKLLSLIPKEIRLGICFITSRLKAPGTAMAGFEQVQDEKPTEAEGEDEAVLKTA